MSLFPNRFLFFFWTILSKHCIKFLQLLTIHSKSASQKNDTLKYFSKIIYSDLIQRLRSAHLTQNELHQVNVRGGMRAKET